MTRPAARRDIVAGFLARIRRADGVVIDGLKDRTDASAAEGALGLFDGRCC
jgi:hypothetical protein